MLGAVEGDLRFRYTMIRAAMERCLLYFGWEGFLIRPYIAPTGQHPHFTDADQRVYISATLGGGGELERAFGRAPITRLPVPAGWDQRSSGRRFFLFPELVREVDARSLTKAVIADAGKALLIAPSDRRLDEAITSLVPDGTEVFGKGDIERSLDGFRQAPLGVLALANRYDGIDLADKSCRLTVLDGLPSGEHLQERFLVRSLRAGRVLEERLRTRIIQGAGRCTRGLKDHSAVVILGAPLTRFLQRPEVRSALRAETQAEISFGIVDSEVGQDELRARREFVHHSGRRLAERRRALHSGTPSRSVADSAPGTEALAASAGIEVKAWGQLWRGEYLAASQTAVEVAQRLTDGVLSPYRALWLYFASAWQSAAVEEAGDAALAASAKELLRKAHAAAKGTTWLRELAPLPPGEMLLDPIDEIAVRAVAEHPARRMPAAKWAKLTAEMIEGLTGTDPGAYERCLSTLGALLGAEAAKPSGKGRADSVWIFGDLWWLTLEAKSEALPTGLVSMDNIRQTNTHLRSVATDRDEVLPDGSVSVIVTPKELVDSDAVAIADEHLHLCKPSTLLSIAQDTIESWRQIRASAMNLEGAEAHAAIRQRFADRRVVPSAIRERIADRPVAG